MSKRSGGSVKPVTPGSTRALVALSLALSWSACTPTSNDAGPGPAGGSGGTAVVGTGGGGASAGGGASGGGAGSGGASASGGASGGAPGTGTGGAGGGAASGGTAGADAGLAVDDGGGSKPDRAPTPNGPGKIVLVAGGGNGGDGTPALMASTNKPFGAVTDPVNGDVYIAEYGSNKIRRIDDKGIISTVMGAGAAGPGGNIKLNQPHNLLFQPNTRNLFVADTFAGRVIKMDAATGESVVFAGSGGQVAMNLGRAYCLAFDATGEHLYVTGGGVTVVNLKTMMVTRVDTPTPRVIAVDSKNNLYLGGGSSLRVADPTGKIMDVMGSGGLAAPKHLSVDLDDNVIITDTESDTIRKWVAASKTVVKIAGSGAGGTGTLGGAPELAQFARPHGAFVDAQGRVYIADSFNNRVLRIDY